MADTEVKIICKDCDGTGQRRGGIPPEPTDTCGDCLGTGYVARGVIKIDLDAVHNAQDAKLDALDAKLDAIEAKIDAL